jgi:hypothetical protein
MGIKDYIDTDIDLIGKRLKDSALKFSRVKRNKNKKSGKEL